MSKLAERLAASPAPTLPMARARTVRPVETRSSAAPVIRMIWRALVVVCVGSVLYLVGSTLVAALTRQIAAL